MVQWLSEFHQSSNPVQTHLLHKCYSVITHNIFNDIYVSFCCEHKAGAARRRQGRMTIWGSWTRPCSCTWITAAAMAPRTKSKGVSVVYYYYYACTCSSPTGIQLQLPCFCLPFLLAGSQMQLIVSGSNACRLVQSYQLLAAFFFLIFGCI